jgi:hypothetical protein
LEFNHLARILLNVEASDSAGGLPHDVAPDPDRRICHRTDVGRLPSISISIKTRMN